MTRTLFTNARLLLDGFGDLQPGYSVLVADGRIAALSRAPIAPSDARVIDVGGRTLMPGLIDAHAHITGLSLTPKNIAYPQAEIAIAGLTEVLAQAPRVLSAYTRLRRALTTDKPDLAVFVDSPDLNLPLAAVARVNLTEGPSQVSRTSSSKGVALSPADSSG